MKKLSVIFDIDGVIVDSEQLHFEVLQVLVPNYIKKFNPQQLVGLSLKETLRLIGVNDLLISDIESKVGITYERLLTINSIRSDVNRLISLLLQHDIPFGFVSTAPRNICLANLKLLGLEFDPPLISGDDIEKTKPHPDPYIKMLEIIGANPENTVVIEDTDLGIWSAKEAGIKRIYAWPHALSDNQNYQHASAIIINLFDIEEFSTLSY
ncbi:HAD-IA family hydrolase [Providencia alcalifaciens]|uniref:HAD family hydrolase n=1 Tax=Providencia alcalifaciens TaxID=126385 RepID=UPI0015D029B1|nr:HAD-IA family hydrolase [Providencia alcalifaciens]MBF0693130.1 HAD-IA family hydrolase [Providencia alcalifaciens]NYS91634.1 HAD-IA family hydrolase [Providencia alcalifaciens]